MFKVDNFISFHDLTPAANFLWASTSITFCLGYEPEDVVGVAAYDVIHPDDAAYVKVTHQENVLNEIVGTQLALRYKHKNGTWLPFMVFFSLCYDYIVSCATLIEQTDGTIRQLSTHSAAMTSLVGSQEEEFERIRRHHEAFYANTWNPNVLDPEPRVCMILNRFSRSLGIMYASPSCQLIFQVEPELMIGKPFLLYIRSDDLASFVEQVDLAKSTNVVTHMRFWFQSPNCMDEIPCEAMLFGAADGMIAILRRCKPFVRKRLIVGDGSVGRSGGISRVYLSRSNRRNVSAQGNNQRRFTAERPSVNWGSSPSVSPLSSTHSSFISTASEATIPTNSYMSHGSSASDERTSTESSLSYTSSLSSPPAVVVMPSMSTPLFQTYSHLTSTLSTPPRSCASSARSASSSARSASSSAHSVSPSSGSYITGGDTIGAFGTRSYRAPLRSMPVGSINSIMNLDREHNRLRPLRSIHRDESDVVDSSTPLPSGYQLREHHVQESDLDEPSFFQQKSQLSAGHPKKNLGTHPYRQSSPRPRDQPQSHSSVYQQELSQHTERAPLYGQQHQQQDLQDAPFETDQVLDHEQLAVEMMELELEESDEQKGEMAM
ncbi:hypothetical protein EMPS_06368 [Entomortierella parvispora]|uniref:PAS domain-containing protein n=1 Tax=Entomortierella parvispora TaxID=205924 RepID=A0A9P3HC60_9FUNG|nr:hypothetical protein EMPS_06368 [Entomortierella parvispora]